MNYPYVPQGGYKYDTSCNLSKDMQLTKYPDGSFSGPLRHATPEEIVGVPMPPMTHPQDYSGGFKPDPYPIADHLTNHPSDFGSKSHDKCKSYELTPEEKFYFKLSVHGCSPQELETAHSNACESRDKIDNDPDAHYDPSEYEIYQTRLILNSNFSKNRCKRQSSRGIRVLTPSEPMYMIPWAAIKDALYDERNYVLQHPIVKKKINKLRLAESYIRHLENWIKDDEWQFAQLRERGSLLELDKIRDHIYDAYTRSAQHPAPSGPQETKPEKEGQEKEQPSQGGSGCN